MHRIAGFYLSFLIIGYVFFGKGFAYVGVAPLYVSEIGLGLGALSLAAALAVEGRTRARGCERLPLLLLAAFVAWQLFRTLPYLRTHGLDSARDAMLWGYSAYAVLIYALLPGRAVGGILVAYRRLVPVYLVWILVAMALMQSGAVTLRYPGAPIPFLWLKAPDVGVHLAGVGAFMLLRLDTLSKPWTSRALSILWLLWGLGWLTYGSSSRAGMLSALVGLGVVVLVRPKVRWGRPLAVGLVLLSVLSLSKLKAPVTGGHEVSFEQMTQNVTSLVGQGDERLRGTMVWRLAWWLTIVDYTVRGDHFWLGKGYGVNLANDDGFQVTHDKSLRSPHNAFMTVLARSGVPGLVLWCAFLLSFFRMLVRRHETRVQGGESLESRLAIWVVAYGLAFLFNASFDVFLEGPMGGVLFWSLVGFGLVIGRYMGDGRSAHSSRLLGTPATSKN